MTNKINSSGNKIQRTFVTDEAYKILEEQIVFGKLAPKTQIKIKDLSEDLGISRTPVREAILRLENEGLVVSKPNLWTQVAPIDIESVKDIYPLVAYLETFALRDGFDNVDDDFVCNLKEINLSIKEAYEAHDLKRLLELDNDFHDKIISLSANKEVQGILNDLKKKIIRIEVYVYNNMSRDYRTSNQHEDIIKAFEKRDENLCVEELNNNWISTLNDFKDLIDNFKE